MKKHEWAGADGPVGREVVAQSERCLATYREDRLRVEQDAAIETGIAQGGYGRKQLYELIQNGADALLGSSGNIEVVLGRDCLYIANEGRPMSVDGVSALMASHLSRKRGDEIGRFGLGFKSVVAISDGPRIFSRSGSFAFDRASARDMIAAVVPDAPAYPMMRTAEAIDPSEEAAEDSVLDRLTDWATTVVKVPLIGSHAELQEDLKSFPAAFLLFSSHAAKLTLADEVANSSREVTLRKKRDGVHILIDSGSESLWRVARREHRPSKAALRDAGELAHRDTISVAWAIPLSGRDPAGQFWAFFPTQDKTTLSGIVNAPWKLSDDRRNLLPGEFNTEILQEVLPGLVAAEWPKLHNPDDPSWALDLLPARGREARSWADDELNRPIVDNIRSIASLPDVEGVLKKPKTLRIHPRGVEAPILEAWRSLVPVPTGWVHHSVDSSAERRAKAERLLGGETDEEAFSTAGEWAEALVDEPTPAASAVAIDLVRQLARVETFAQSARAAKVVLLEDGTLAPAKRGRVFVRSSPDEQGYAFIHPDLASLPGVVDALEELGIQLLDRAGELRNALALTDQSRIDWGRVWRLARDCSLDMAQSIMSEELHEPVESAVKVRNRAGNFVPMGRTFIPGGVIRPQARGDEKFTVDVDYHREDMELLERLGAVSQPVLRTNVPREPWLRAYEQLIKEKYIADLSGSRPSVERLAVDGPMPPWPLDALSQLSPESAAALTEVALELASRRPWTIKHATSASYPKKSYRDPVEWWVRKHGYLTSSIGPFPAGLCIQAADGIDPHVFPVVELTEETVKFLGVASDVGALPDAAWALLLNMARVWERNRRDLLYAWAVHYQPPPQAIVATVADRQVEQPPGEVAVASNEEDFRSLQDQRTPVILVKDDADVGLLISEWGLEDGKALLDQELAFVANGEPQVLVDAYPKLRVWDVPSTIKLQLCESIELVTVTNSGTLSRPVECFLNEDVLLSTSAESRDVLRHASELLQLGMTSDDIRSVIDHVRTQAMNKLVAKVRSTEGVEAKLALLIGEEALMRQVPSAALEAVALELNRQPTALELAKLVLAVHGVRSLQAFKQLLEEKGLEPPHQWAGGSATRRFVADLGFPVEFAGFASDERPAMFGVDGPADLSPLHQYQVTVTERIKSMLRGEAEARGMVSLPTGAGKTRVAVQALIEEVRDGHLSGPIVWIAQSDELCEQAIETWSFIWRSIGPPTQLNIGRLWSTNDVDEVGTGTQLIVATPDKLKNCIEKSAYSWLTETEVVIVDEAHTSVAPMYTAVLEWLGRGRSRKERRPLIGLTATPFRNTNEAETRQLAARYDKNRLDEGAFAGDPYEHLQEIGVLATVEQEILQGVEIELNAQELADTERYKDIPKSVQVRLGTNVERNETILKSVASLPEDWTVLLFATSVANAHALASLLTFRGIPAVAISADTDMAARRFYIEEFRAGRIRVITNYNVLAQGFDAPAVRAVYVTRPTYSANLYQQMIGRGLRGPLNGGSERVKIVNVQDNVEQYGGVLAFTEFEHLWARDEE